MAYDEHCGVVVLQGGDSENGDRDTWEWDGQTWTLNDTGIQPPREFPYDPQMVYDGARRVLVLFVAGQTWEFNGVEWVLRVDGPAVGRYVAMAYDSARGVTVPFGGYAGAGARDTTWEWDGKVWTERSHGPLGRTSAELTYDAARRQTVLFGGFRRHEENAAYTYGWDGRQ